MAPTGILRARKQVRSWTRSEAKELATAVLRQSRSSEIETLLIQARDRKNA